MTDVETKTQPRSARVVLKLALLVLFALAVLFLRRPDQFLHPYIWVEGGGFTLPAYVARGWATLFEPLAGYLLVTSKLLDLLGFQISILYAPQIAATLAMLFTCAVVVAIAFSPTYLRAPILCAAAVLLVPSDPEVFGVASYAFWWAGILLFLAVLWERDHQWLRHAYIVIGGLSSPIIGPAVALLGLRFVVQRNRQEFLALCMGGAMALAQFFAMRSQYRIMGSAYEIKFQPPLVLAEKFIGGFFHAYSTPYVGVAVLIALLAAGLIVWRKLNAPFYLLVAMFVIVSTSIAFRVHDGFEMLDPFRGGPRYFFYPFILLSWIMIWLAVVSPLPLRVVFAGAFACAIMLAGTGLSRRHDAVDWKQQILACANSEKYELPIQYIGKVSDMWHLTLTGAQCRDLIARSWF